ncbi:alpha/beta fold hydrolase [Umezakia ovalisporum]|jgi:pimeloyl-ACP methyl ester carboxylesterase|uniref:Alpha/beta hydrolase n=2 Tax=Umezakia ovalisporum TaxID=75695 RepID=A0AA43GXK1_9CYAN|nr:alpha/beta hydrolase [Umezakia ovalisporum]MBI1241034.1 alpha/beta fold hydrolase [Nostoc sp. RI_552]MDH6055809.1 alpha/beta hydrolase [Umezakia ovalisporum FSS-43]MDH6063155.1 alpha/beta hydrolase [Umezakia ovalisporum FSS-62]MDH6068957.1 alpha/beta hydrolase [Umezakia ovalisporum APH033B]MDH6070617.1 alpha/beta hydrolase [Umezakia ovalisporum CobakiLakeA]
MPKVELKPCFLTPNRVQLDYPLFVYLPGLDGTGQLLRSQTAGLELGFDVRCLAIPRQDLTTWDVLSSNVLDLIHTELEKSSQRPVYLCGESFGGCLAMKVATKAPQLFKRIILVNPASAFQLRPWLSWTSQVTYFVPECFYDVGALGLLPFLASLARIPRNVRYELLKTMRSVPPVTVNWRLSLLKEFNVTENQLRQVNQSVLLIAAASDRLLPSVKEAKRLVSILPNTRMVVLPNSGHACLLETNINLYKILGEHNFLEHQLKLSQELETKARTQKSKANDQ